MCEKCPIDQRYPYYGFPVTPDSRKLRDEAERYREIAIRCFVAESDCADVKRADALWREMCRAGDEARFLCSNARRLEMEEALQCRSRSWLTCLVDMRISRVASVIPRAVASHMSRSTVRVAWLRTATTTSVAVTKRWKSPWPRTSLNMRLSRWHEMSRVVITAQQVKAALEATGYSSIDSNIQTVLREIGRRPALLTAYLSTVINAAADNLPDPRHMDCLF